MQFLVHYDIAPENRDESNERLRKLGVGLPDGVTMINDYHSVTQLEGWAIIEATDPQQLWKAFEVWTNLNVNHITPVISGEALTAVL